MTINECEKNRVCLVKSVNIIDDKLKLRLYEIGIYVGANISLLHWSALKQTYLIQVLDSCFAVKSDVAKLIEVEYV